MGRKGGEKGELILYVSHISVDYNLDCKCMIIIDTPVILSCVYRSLGLYVE